MICHKIKHFYTFDCWLLMLPLQNNCKLKSTGTYFDIIHFINIIFLTGMWRTYLWRASILSAVILLNSSSNRSELSDKAAGALALGEPWANHPISRPKKNKVEVPSMYLSRNRQGVSKGAVSVFLWTKLMLGNHMRNMVQVESRIRIIR